MREDLAVRTSSPQTLDGSLRCVAQCAQDFRTPPDRLGPAHMRQDQISLVQEKRVSWSVVMQTGCAVRFLDRITLGRPEMMADIPQPQQPKTLPILWSPAEVAALLQAPPRLKSRAILTTLSAAGLRVSALCHLQGTDVDSSRMVLHIRQGTGQQDRSVMLAPSLLSLLRAYGPQTQPRPWRFPGRDPARPLSRTTVDVLCHQAGVRAQVGKAVHPPMVRHAFASHRLDAGVDVRRLQLLFGPRRLRTTTRSLHVRPHALGAIPSPLELLPPPAPAAPQP
jgi:integrase/recombinase XerD